MACCWVPGLPRLPNNSLGIQWWREHFIQCEHFDAAGGGVTSITSFMGGRPRGWKLREDKTDTWALVSESLADVFFQDKGQEKERRVHYGHFLGAHGLRLDVSQCAENDLSGTVVRAAAFILPDAFWDSAAGGDVIDWLGKWTTTSQGAQVSETNLQLWMLTAMEVGVGFFNWWNEENSQWLRDPQSTSKPEDARVYTFDAWLPRCRSGGYRERRDCQFYFGGGVAALNLTLGAIQRGNLKFESDKTADGLVVPIAVMPVRGSAYDTALKVGEGTVVDLFTSALLVRAWSLASGSVGTEDGLRPEPYFDKIYPPLSPESFLEVFGEKIDLATGGQHDIRVRLYEAFRLRKVQDYSAPNSTFLVTGGMGEIQ